MRWQNEQGLSSQRAYARQRLGSFPPAAAKPSRQHNHVHAATRPPTASHHAPAASKRQSTQAVPLDSSPAATGRNGLLTASMSTS